MVEIVDLIHVIFVAKKSEKVLQSLWLSSSVLVSSRSADWRSSMEIFHLFVAEEYRQVAAGSDYYATR